MSPAPLRTTARARWHGLWDRLSLYLPVLLMGALALITYGIVQRAAAPPRSEDAPLATGQPDYRLEGFTLRRYDAHGRLASTLSGAALEHYPVTATVQVWNAALERIDYAEGTRLLARARMLHTDDERTVYHLRGDVHALREAWPDARQRQAKPRLTVQSEALTWHAQRRVLESDQPVRLTRGADTLRAQRLRYDERNGIADLQGQVRATLTARTGGAQ